MMKKKATSKALNKIQLVELHNIRRKKGINTQYASYYHWVSVRIGPSSEVICKIPVK